MSKELVEKLENLFKEVLTSENAGDLLNELADNLDQAASVLESDDTIVFYKGDGTNRSSFYKAGRSDIARIGIRTNAIGVSEKHKGNITSHDFEKNREAMSTFGHEGAHGIKGGIDDIYSTRPAVDVISGLKSMIPNPIFWKAKWGKKAYNAQHLQCLVDGLGYCR